MRSRSAPVRHQIEIAAGDLERRLGERHLEVVDRSRGRTASRRTACAAPGRRRRSRRAAPAPSRRRTRPAAACASASTRRPTGSPAGRPGRPRSTAAARAASRAPAAPSSSTGVNARKNGTNARVLVHQRAIGRESRPPRARPCSSRPPGGGTLPSASGKAASSVAGDGGLEVAVREPRQAVLVRDRLALLGQLEAPGRMARRLREDRRVGRPAAAPGAAAAAMEDRELDVGARRASAASASCAR